MVGQNQYKRTLIVERNYPVGTTVESSSFSGKATIFFYTKVVKEGKTLAKKVIGRASN